MRLFILSAGKWILIDKIDLIVIQSCTWKLAGVGYIYGSSGKYRDQYLHRVIAKRMNLDLTNEIDHEDGNILNNQRLNLRPATHSQNQMNRKKQLNNTSGFIGVYRVGQKYCASIRVHGKQIHLAMLDTLEEAIKARKEAEIKYFGEFIRKDTNDRSNDDNS